MNRKLKVLIVDDEALIAMDLQRYVMKQNANVCSVAHSGEQAVKIAELENPDLVLMDIHLRGGMDGIEAARVILNNHKTSIVFITGYSFSEMIDRTAPLEPLDYLEKPVELSRLQEILEQLNC